MLTRPPRVLALLATIVLVAGACGGPVGDRRAKPGRRRRRAAGHRGTDRGARADLPHPRVRGGGPALVLLPRRRRGPERRRPTEEAVAADFADEVPGQQPEVRGHDLRRGPGRPLDADRGRQRRRTSPGPSASAGIAAVRGPVARPHAVPRGERLRPRPVPGEPRRVQQDVRRPDRRPVRALPVGALVRAGHVRGDRARPSRPTSTASKYEMPDGTDGRLELRHGPRARAAAHRRPRTAATRRIRHFDPKHIVQYGFEPQRDDLRGFGARTSGAGNLDSGDGETAAIPPAWAAAWKWVYDGIWTDHFIMTEQTFNSDAIAGGDQAFFSGKVAMSTNFLWITYGLGPTTARPRQVGHRRRAGVQRRPHGPAERRHVRHPQGRARTPTPRSRPSPTSSTTRGDELLQLYGGMPAREAERPAFLEALAAAEGFPEPTPTGRSQATASNTPTSRTSRARCPSTTRPTRSCASTAAGGYDRRPGHRRPDRPAPGRDPGGVGQVVAEPASGAPQPLGGDREPLDSCRSPSPRHAAGSPGSAAWPASARGPHVAPGAPRGAPGAALHLAVDRRLPRVHGAADDRDVRLHVPERHPSPGGAARGSSGWTTT